MRSSFSFLPFATAALATVIYLKPAAANDDGFERLANTYIDQTTVLYPVTATRLGDHRYDDELDDVSRDSRDRQLAFARRVLKELGSIDTEKLSRANQIDANLLRNELEQTVWSLEKLQEWAWNPLVYTDMAGSAIYALMARDFAPLVERLRNAAARLNQMERFFRQVRKTLQPQRVPRIHAETALRQHPGLMSIVDAMIVPALDDLAAQDRRLVEAAIEQARSAADKHGAWLEEQLVPKAAGDFRLGRELYERKLHFSLDTPLKRLQIRDRAELEYAAVREQMYQAARLVYQQRYPYTMFPDDPGHDYQQAIIRAALSEAYQDIPGRDEVVEVAREALGMTTDFVRQKNLVRIPDDPLEIIIMPEFQRGVSVAYCDAPGPLEQGQKTFYAVAPLPESWSDDQVESFLREYNVLSIHQLTMHEAMPGHYLQLAHAKEHPSVLRRLLASGPFIEGWAVYAERVMIEAGYFDNDALMRLINLKWYLRAVVNAIIDQAIHVDGMSEEAAMRLMVEGAFQEQSEAAGKWVRAQLTAGQLSTYFVGYQEHADLRREVQRRHGVEFALRDYHDAVLSHGSPPVRYVRAMMLDEPIPASRP